MRAFALRSSCGDRDTTRPWPFAAAGTKPARPGAEQRIAGTADDHADSSAGDLAAAIAADQDVVTGAGFLYGEKDGVPSKFVVDKIGGLIELRLIGGNLGAARALNASDAKKKPVRRLWAKGKGNFRTRGRLASATVRGTWWLTADFRAYTLISVRQGSVTVRDFVKRKTVIIRAGKSYKANQKKR